jgi:hypothetical protein
MKEASLTVHSGLLCMRSSCTLFMYNLYKGYGQGTIIFTSNLPMASIQIYRWIWFSVPCILDWWGNIQRAGVNNFHNTWMGTGSPHGTWCSSFQQGSNINDRARIKDDYLTGPYMIVNCLGGIQCDFLHTTLPLLSVDVPLYIHYSTWLQQDDAPPDIPFLVATSTTVVNYGPQPRYGNINFCSSHWSS